MIFIKLTLLLLIFNISLGHQYHAKPVRQPIKHTHPTNESQPAKLINQLNQSEENNMSGEGEFIEGHRWSDNDVEAEQVNDVQVLTDDLHVVSEQMMSDEMEVDTPLEMDEQKRLSLGMCRARCVSYIHPQNRTYSSCKARDWRRESPLSLACASCWRTCRLLMTEQWMPACSDHLRCDSGCQAACTYTIEQQQLKNFPMPSPRWEFNEKPELKALKGAFVLYWSDALIDNSSYTQTLVYQVEYKNVSDWVFLGHTIAHNYLAHRAELGPENTYVRLTAMDAWGPVLVYTATANGTVRLDVPHTDEHLPAKQNESTTCAWYQQRHTELMAEVGVAASATLLGMSVVISLIVFIGIRICRLRKSEMPPAEV